MGRCATPLIWKGGEVAYEAARARRLWATERLRSLGLESVLFPMVVVIVLVLVLYPLLMLLWRSLATSEADPTLSAKWYIRAYTDPSVRMALLNTLGVVGGSVAIAFFFGVSLAWLIARTNTPGARALELLPILPFVTAPFIGAVGWVFLLAPKVGFINVFLRTLVGSAAAEGPTNIYTAWGMIWVMGLYLTPYVYLFTSGAFKSLDPALEEVSRVSGAGTLGTFLKVTLPLVTPALLSGTLLAFVMGAGMFAIPAALGITARTYVLTTLIWRNLNTWPAKFELAAAMGTILLLMSLIGLYLHRRAIGGKEYTTITGKGFRPARTDLGRWRYGALAFCLAYLVLAVGLPYLALAYASLTRYWTIQITPGIFTLDNYRFVLLEYKITWPAIRNSLLLSASGATICVLLAAVVSFIVVRTRARGRGILDYVSMMPVGVPATVLAVGLLAAWIRPPLVLYGTAWILLVAYITHFLPFGVRSAASSLHQLSRELEESSRICGASWLRTFAQITLPLIRPGVMAGWILLFIIFMREMNASVLLYTPATVVISVALFDMWMDGLYNRIAAFSFLIVLVSVAAVALAQKVMGVRFAEGGGQ